MTAAAHDVRERTAREAFEHLGPRASDLMRLQVTCARNHHLAACYDTDAGTIFRAVTHARSHGKRDLYDSGHHGSSQGKEWFDILSPGVGPAVDDALPAGCECGPYTLSRARLIQFIADGEHHVVVD